MTQEKHLQKIGESFVGAVNPADFDKILQNARQEYFIIPISDFLKMSDEEAAEKTGLTIDSIRVKKARL